MALRVLFQSRTTLYSVPGGDTIQVIKTAEALRRAGCVVDVSTELEPDLTGYDIVHLFNLMRPQEVYLQAQNAKRKGIKVALSTIYGPYIDYDVKARGGIAGLLARLLPHSQLEYLKVAARAIVNKELNRGTWCILANGYLSLQNKIVGLSDVFLPNSQSEMERVWKDFPLSRDKVYRVVPNAVDTCTFNPDSVLVPQNLKHLEGCILSVARIEGRKCQLDLVRAMRDLPWRLVIIGKPAPNHLEYYEKVRREAGQNVEFVDHVDHEQLAIYYKAARIHCLISWMETPGLSSLEAGAMGCGLVITRNGDTYDYFGDFAEYCEPGNVQSIRQAIVSAMESPVPENLKSHIIQNFTWERAASATIEGYHEVLS